MKHVLEWAMKSDKYVISLCHGPASFLSAALGRSKDDLIYKEYKICVFPDSIDKKNPDIGYMPGPMPWIVAEKLKELGVEILNRTSPGKPSKIGSSSPVTARLRLTMLVKQVLGLSERGWVELEGEVP